MIYDVFIRDLGEAMSFSESSTVRLPTESTDSEETDPKNVRIN